MQRSLIPNTLTSLFIYGCVFTVPLIQASEISFPHLETVGVSLLTVEADMAEINVEVAIKAKTAKEAKSLSDKAVSKFIERLKAAGITQADIQSANLYLQPQYQYTKGKPAKLIGYSANRKVIVKVKALTRLNSILDSALEEGINRINNIALKTSKETEYLTKARTAAIIDAKNKAQSIAEGFGEKLDGVWEIRYFEQHPVRPVMLKMNEAGPNYDIAESYQQGQVTIKDRVEVIFKLE
ncbi:oxidative stress defense protein [Shewanella sp. VB17]|uniref:oxidative stress defense protein n=1 Tax=Shewanella sp. VB17 TaxID=2739432 RepID=UPI0015649883|nr:oxidative stress defense protein [Shewanella sp. VB17]NRD72432.1 oxidative stress defense protein [Shewanella sp. VB17]